MTYESAPNPCPEDRQYELEVYDDLAAYYLRYPEYYNPAEAALYPQLDPAITIDALRAQQLTAAGLQGAIRV